MSDPKPSNYLIYSNSYNLPFSIFNKDRPMTYDYPFLNKEPRQYKESYNYK